MQPMTDYVGGRGTSELATQARQEVVLFLVKGRPEEVDAFAKRANSGCLEPHDREMVINMDLVSQSELGELLKMIHRNLSEVIGRRMQDDCCESLIMVEDSNHRVCPRFYEFIAGHKIGALEREGNLVISKSSDQLKEWQKRKILAEGCLEHSLSNIPIGL